MTRLPTLCRVPQAERKVKQICRVVAAVLDDSWRLHSRVGFIVFQLMSLSGLPAQQAGPDKLIEATRYAAFATDSMECRPDTVVDPVREAVKWTASAIKTARNFRSKDATERGLAAAFLARQVRRAEDLNSQMASLDATYKKTVDDVKHNRLESAASAMLDLKVPLCDARFAALKRYLGDLREHVDALAGRADAMVDKDPKSALKLYEEAQSLDVDEAAIGPKLAAARSLANRKATRAVTALPARSRKLKKLPPELQAGNERLGNINGSLTPEARVVPLLDRALDAMGGLNALLEIKDSSVVSQGTLYPGAIPIHTSTRSIAPHYIRQDTELSSGNGSAYTDGSSGWLWTPSGVSALSARQISDLVLYSDLVLNAKQDRSLAVTTISDDTIQISTLDGQNIKIQFDGTTGLPSAITHPYVSNGIYHTAVTTFSDWREIEGFEIAFRQVTEVDGRKGREDTVVDIRINSGLTVTELSRTP